MELKEILATVDHTLLTQNATWEEIQQILDDAIHYGTASACIPASYVKQAAAYVDGKLPICTVIGFPNGYSTTNVKVFETKDAVANGASEIDMVINITDVKNKRFNLVEEEIRQIHEACQGRILKVIVEICLLTTEELIELCKVVTRAGAEYIKTSTGLGSGGASLEDIRLFKKHIGPNVQIKAAGGIRSITDMKAYIAEGCSRIGASAAVELLKNHLNEEV